MKRFDRGSHLPWSVFFYLKTRWWWGNERNEEQLRYPSQSPSLVIFFGWQEKVWNRMDGGRFFLFFWFAVFGTDRECHELGSPDKGNVMLTGRFFADRAIYTCDEGHRLVGVEFRLCQADGSWSATEPSCQKIGNLFFFCFCFLVVFLLLFFSRDGGWGTNSVAGLRRLQDFTGFYWVLLGFTGSYRVLLGVIGFYWVLLGFTGFELSFVVVFGFTMFYWVLLGFTGFYWVWQGFTGCYWVLLGFTGLFFITLLHFRNGNEQA